MLSVDACGGECTNGDHDLFKLLGPLLVAASRESEEGFEESSSVVQLLDYLQQSPQEQISFLEKEPQFLHYLHRLVHSETRHGRDRNIAVLQNVFPAEVARLQDSSPPLVSYCTNENTEAIIKDSLPPENKRVAHKRSVTDGDKEFLFKYSPSKLPVTFKGPDAKVSDLPAAVQSVYEEMRHARQRGTVKRKKNVRRHSENLDKSLLQPMYESGSNDLTLFPREKPIRKSLRVPPIYIHGHPIHTAQDVIEAFASGLLKAESEFVYLNYTNPDKRMPYDLTVVPKTKIEPEHFVMSKFGIICVIPDEASDMQTFSEWLREASMFMLLRKIPLFKNYKVKRAFDQWHKATRLLKFWRLRAKIGRLTVRYLPTYAKALLTVKCLSDDLLTVPFHEFKQHGQYTLDTLDKSFRKTQSMARRYLNKYFRYCKRAICEAIESVHDEVLKLEAEHNHKPFVSDLPISIQQQNHKTLKKDLDVALDRKKKLGAFVSLAEQMAGSCLLQVTQKAICSWKDLLWCQESILHKGSSGFQISLRLTVPESELEKEDNESDEKYFLFSSFEFDSFGKYSQNSTSFNLGRTESEEKVI